MKQRSTTPVSISLTAKASAVAAIVLVASAGILQFGSSVLAVDYDAQIRAKEQESQKYNAEADRLGNVAGTLQEALDELNSQVSTIQKQISESQQKHDSLIKQIEKNQQTIGENKKALGRILSDMYVDDQISPLEMLASSDSIGDYVDKQEQRGALRSSLNAKIKDIKVLQKKLEEDKKSVENVLNDQESQRKQLASKQGEQKTLLDQTKNDQGAYQQLAASRNAEINQLREQQKKSNCDALGGVWSSGTCVSSGGGSGAIPPASPGNGGYPAIWANAPLDAYIDPWGLYTRECVSYVAWKVSSTGRYVPHFGGAGHARQWPSTLSGVYSPTLGGTIQQGSTPKAGSAAIMYGGPYGHVMYVEAVNGDGTITVSDYNLGVDGLYRYYTRSASGLTYIYF